MLVSRVAEYGKDGSLLVFRRIWGSSEDVVWSFAVQIRKRHSEMIVETIRRRSRTPAMFFEVEAYVSVFPRVSMKKPWLRALFARENCGPVIIIR